MVKANAYGHGALRCARALRRGRRVSVAFLGEALGCARGWHRCPILLLEACSPPTELAEAARHRLT